jgi:hypothetical protein
VLFPLPEATHNRHELARGNREIDAAKNFNAMSSGVDGLSEGVSFEDGHPHLL